jgi:hypothetical protein
MNRRNNVNINELINRFEPPSDEELNDNVKYVKVSRYGDDQNSLMKYSERNFDRNAKKRNSATMTNAFELTKQTIAMILQRISGFLEMVSKFPFPRMSVMSFGLTSLLAVFLCHRASALSRLPHHFLDHLSRLSLVQSRAQQGPQRVSQVDRLLGRLRLLHVH